VEQRRFGIPRTSRESLPTNSFIVGRGNEGDGYASLRQVRCSRRPSLRSPLNVAIAPC